MMSSRELNARRLLRLIEEIISKEKELSEMDEAWNSDDDCAAASSDPGLQFELGEEISDLIKKFKEEVKEL